MGAQGKSPSSTNSSQLVKVYHLNDDGKWDDRGMGHVTVGYLESEDLCLFVIGEENNVTLLAHRIGSDDNYRRQEETIISWRDPEYATELALSFQEIAGCSYIWEHICSAQKNPHLNSDHDVNPRSVVEPLEISGLSQARDEVLNGASSQIKELPPIELSTLPAILKIVLGSSISDQMRATELLLLEEGFFPKLIGLFRICEDLENFDSLHMIFKLVKGIISLNSPQIFEKIFDDQFIMDIIGILEYDRKISPFQRHRAFLKEHVVFKEAIPIKDSSVLSKIHQTYRIGYIKDIILPRTLDDATIANLNSIIHKNNAIVVCSLKDDSSFIHELFAKIRSSTSSTESKKNLVFFLQEFCSLTKSLQVVQQLRLFRDLINEGIFDVITDLLQSEDKKLMLTGTDILILFLSQDSNLLRTYVIREEGRPLLGLLVKGMITDFGEDMHCQFLEILRSLLDSYAAGAQRDTIIEIFYNNHLDQLVDVIVLSCPPQGVIRLIGKSAASGGPGDQAVAKPEVLSNICELLCFCVVHYPHKIKCNFILNNVLGKVLFLVNRKEKYLVVSAVRFLRIIISRNDDQLLSHLVKKNLMKPVIDAFVGNGDRYNLLNSAVLDLFEYIRKENLKTLIVYIVNSFWSQLVKFENLETISAVKLKYEQLQEVCETRNDTNVVNSRKRNDERALEKEEEDYFNEDSDEEDTATGRASEIHNEEAQTALPTEGGSGESSLSPRPGASVDYAEDREHIPPSRSKSEISCEEEETFDLRMPKRKLTSSEGLQPAKKQKFDKDSSRGDDNVAASHSTSAPGSSPCKAVVHEIPRATEGKCSSGEETENAEPVVPKSCTSSTSRTSNTKLSEEVCPLSQPNDSTSSPENVGKGANGTNSDQSSLR